MGLTPYQQKDAAYFFGREAETEIIAANLLASRLTVLYGESGVGKSSVLGAGVAHHLEEQALRNLAELGSREFAVVLFSSWRDEPVAAMFDRISEAMSELADGHSIEAPMPTGSLTADLQAWTDRLDIDLLIILDQFEEYSLYHSGEDGEGSFALEWPRAIRHPDLRVNFLISIREDALAKLDQFKGRIPNLFENYLRIEQLSREAGRMAIERPIAQYNRSQDGVQIRIEPALVEAVLDQVQTGQVVSFQVGRGATAAGDAERAVARIETPYLQLVLSRLWIEEIRDGSPILRLETLDRLGGAERIVRTHLDEALTHLSEDEQGVAARAFRYLVTPSGTKIAHTLTDLAEYAGIPEDALTPVVDKLANSDVRILRPVASPPGRLLGPRFEIFHDTLSAPILDWRARYEKRELTRRLEREKADAEEQARKEGKRARRFRGLAIVSLFLAGVAGVSTLLAIQATREADRQQRGAQEDSSRAFAAVAREQISVDPVRSVRLALEAWDASPTPDAEAALRSATSEPKVQAILRGHRAEVLSAQISPDGTRVLTGAADGTARVWDAATGEELLKLAVSTDGVAAPDGDSAFRFVSAVNAQFSLDGSMILTSVADPGDLRIWDSATGEQLLRLSLNGSNVTDATFSPDGTKVLAAVGKSLTVGDGFALGVDGAVRIWDALTGREIQRLRAAGTVYDASFSPDGSQVLAAIEPRSAFNSLARIWDIATGTAVQALETDGFCADFAIFSPEGDRVLMTGGPGEVWNWDLATERADILKIGGFFCADLAVFSPDGTKLFTANDGAVRIWDLSTGRPSILPDTGKLFSAEFSIDGTLVLTAGADGIARIWDAATGRQVLTLRGHESFVSTAGFGPQDDLAVTASADGSARIWDIATAGITIPGRASRPLEFEHKVADLSPDGTKILTAGKFGITRIWDAGSGRELQALQAQERFIRAAEFSPDGTKVLTVGWDGFLFLSGGSGSDGTVRIWDATSGSELQAPRVHEGFVQTAEFSPDGTKVLTTGGDGVVRIWDAASGRELQALQAHDGSVHSAEFSRDGTKVLTTGDDGVVRIWDAVGGKETMTLIHGELGAVGGEFNPDGTKIVTFGDNGLVRLWDVSTGTKLGILESDEGVVLGAFSPDGSRVLTFPSQGDTARIWDTRSMKEILSMRATDYPVYDLFATYSPDGNWVAVLVNGSAIEIYDAETGRRVSAISLRALANTVTFAPDSRTLVMGPVSLVPGGVEVRVCGGCQPIEEIVRSAREQLGHLG